MQYLFYFMKFFLSILLPFNEIILSARVLEQQEREKEEGKNAEEMFCVVSAGD